MSLRVYACSEPLMASLKLHWETVQAENCSPHINAVLVI